MSSSDAIRGDSKLPAVDARLVAPESRFEILDGALVHVSPADEAHSALHSKIAALLAAHVVTRFMVAVDMLTRTSRTSDFAPDVSVFPRARNPQTGGRQLEQLAFEVVSTESLSHARRKAAKLVARGVRRVFTIDVKRGRVLEWSRSRATWMTLDPEGHIKDPALVAPLPIKELVTAAAADDAMVRALAAKKNPVIKEIRSEGKHEGLVEGKRKGLVEGKRKGLVEGKRKGLAEGKRKGLAEGKRKGLAEGKRKGLAEGKREGLAEGKRKGLAEGKRKTLAKILLSILTTRGFTLKHANRARILGERDPERLHRWVTRAAICRDIAEVFEKARSLSAGRSPP